MIEEKKLQVDVYNYLKHCEQICQIRGVGVITDKQSIFYSQLHKDDYRAHEEISSDIEKTIHPNDTNNFLIKEQNTYIFAFGYSYNFIISLPHNDELSMSQLEFIYQVIDQVEKYNNEQQNENKQVNIQIFSGNEIFETKVSKENVDELKEKLSKKITKKIKTEEEIILGKTHSKDEIKKNISYHIGIKENMTLKELHNVIITSMNYITDSYYREIFYEMFPNYDRVSNLIDIISKLEISNQNIEDLTLENAEHKLLDVIQNLFSNIKTLDELEKIINSINSISEKENIIKIFPNYETFLNYYHETRNLTEEEKITINEQLQKTSSYKDILNIIINFGYKKKIEFLSNLRYLITYQKETLQKNINNKNIITNKKQLLEIITNVEIFNSQLYDNEEKLQQIVKNIIEEEEKINYYNKEICYNTSSIFRKIFYRNKVRKYNDAQITSKTEKNKLQQERELLEKKIMLLKKQIKTLENQIKNIIKSEHIPRTIDELEKLYSEIELRDEKLINDDIDFYKKQIIEIEYELENATKSGLVIQNAQDIQENNKGKN